jgi:cytochrome subunit of sulfide dehydrogenase
MFSSIGVWRGSLAGVLAFALCCSAEPLAARENGSISAQQAELLAMACFNCHGSEGRLDAEGMPRIAGMPEPVLLAQLRAFKARQIPNTTVMDRISNGFTDAELAALARYFAALGNSTNAGHRPVGLAEEP